MGLPASVWFVIALVAALLGALLLLLERNRTTGTSKDRERWAALRDWTFTEEDPLLPGGWRYGTIHQGGPGVAKNLVSGLWPSDPRRRRIYVFDHEQHGAISSVIVAVETFTKVPAAIELRLATSPKPPDDVGLEGHGPVGKRIGFVADPSLTRPLITPRLAAASDAVGDDVELVWAEDRWVLAAAPVGIDTDRAQDLLGALVEVAAALERAHDPEPLDEPLPGSELPTRTPPGSSSPAESSSSTSSAGLASPEGSSASAPGSSEPSPSSTSSPSPSPTSTPPSSSPPSPSPRPSGRPEGLDFLPRES